MSNQFAIIVAIGAKQKKLLLRVTN